MGGDEQKYVNEAFNTNWIAPLGPNVDGFENDLKNYTGIADVAALSSGTAALHLALILAGVTNGDDVICQSFTFSASANPIVYCGARPIFIDSEPDTWNMCTELLEKAIKQGLEQGRKPKAIVFVHLYGMPAKTQEIVDIANRYQILTIEDAAEALGSEINGKKLGTYGNFGVLSFNGNKIITTSGGGALISNDIIAVEKARFLATQARDPAPHYQHSEIGYNYRMSNICAGIGRGQMRVIDERVKRRREIFDFYYQELSSIPGIDFLIEPSGYFSNRWLSTITVNPKSGVTRETLRLALDRENIESRPLWKPLHLQPVFSSYPTFENGTSAKLFRDGLCLPSGSNLTDEDLNRIVNVIKLAIE